jgi:molecular chaperone GrpE
MTKDKDKKEDIKETTKEQELETKLVDMENNWKRALADYTNQQNRFNEEKFDIRKRANELLILSLLPVLDNMEMLIKHNEDMGFKMIFKDMLKTLKEAGLEEIEVLDKPLDVTLMEAVDSEEGIENQVLKIERKGYFLNGKLIRPAKVIVGKNNKEESK